MRGPGRLFWKLFLGSLFLAALVLGLCAWLITRQTDAFTHAALQQHLLGQAHLLSDMVEDQIDSAPVEELDRLAKKVVAHYPQPIRITFIRTDGVVVGDSLASPAQMESHARRAEVIEALRDGWGYDAHVSHTLAMPMHYLAVRVGPAQAPQGVVRVAMSTEAMGAPAKAIRDLIWRIILVGAAALGLFALGLARLWSRPIKQMTLTARSLSRGDLSARVRVSGRDEVADLGHSLNQMRDHLALQLETIDRQRRILHSILSQLLEGVVVVGSDGRIVLINPAAVRLMGLGKGDARPAVAFEQVHVLQFVSAPQLRDMLLGHQHPNQGETAPAAPGEAVPVQEARIRVQTPEGEISLLARASDIRLPHVSQPGAGKAGSHVARLLVLTDVSDLAKAIQVKADFAANASHELRTPLSAILGAVETLMEMDLARTPEAGRSFIQMIRRHADRMQAMVADLLDLSRLESSPDQFKPQRLVLRQELAEMHGRHAEGIDAKGLQWQAEIDPGLETVLANPHLLRLTLDNLVDNSIKFTDPGGFIRVTCRIVGDATGTARMVAIEVRDNGCGIPPDQQDRVFERFYQVQQARSGSLRGTGLGLSIVRHSVAALGGKVELRSTPGEGTSVTVFIPQAG